MHNGWVNKDTYDAYIALLNKERHLRSGEGDKCVENFQEVAERVIDEESLSVVDVEEVMWPDLYEAFCDEARFVS